VQIAELPLFSHHEATISPAVAGKLPGTSESGRALSLVRVDQVSRVGAKYLELGIGGRKARVRVTDLSTFARLRNAILAHGIVIDSHEKPARWDDYVATLLDMAAKDPAADERGNRSGRKTDEMRQLVSDLVSGSEVIAMGEILQKLQLDGSRTNQLWIGSILRSQGWVRKTVRESGSFAKRWVRIRS
jgi:hypothetical protein